MKQTPSAHVVSAPEAPHFRKLRPLEWRILISIYTALLCGAIVGLCIVGSRTHTGILPQGTVRVTTPYTTYLVGEEISFTVHNDFNSSISFPNTCPYEPLTVYKLSGKNWERLHSKTSPSTCSAKRANIQVSAGGSTTGSFKDWPDLFAEPGDYRIVAYVDYYNVIASQDITIITKPPIPAIPALVPPKATTPSVPQRTIAPQDTPNTNTSTPATSPTNSTPTTLSSKTISLSAGTIVVTYSSTTIYVQTITPAAGYTFEGGRSGSKVEITFKKGGSETQILLYLSGGTLQQRIEN